MRNSKKGFTIVELVIVIAVIAILAAVLIPTFSSIIDKANESSALQKATNAQTLVTMELNGDVSGLKIYYTVDEYVFEYDATATDGEGLHKVDAADEDAVALTDYMSTASTDEIDSLGVTVTILDTEAGED